MQIRRAFDPEFLEEVQLKTLIDSTRQILSHALTAFFRENCEQARGIWAQDDRIDTIHRASFELITQRIQQMPEKASELIQLYLIIKSFEKIADFAVAITHEVIFHTEGEVTRHSDQNVYYENLPAAPTPTPPFGQSFG